MLQGQKRVNRRATNRTKTQYYALEGGLDVVTPALSIKPGYALSMVNYEPWYQGGYRRIPGYERFDGRPKPSEAEFTGFEVSTIAGLTLRDTITGDVSGTTGILIGIWDDDGTYGSDHIGVTKVSGPGFQNGEACNSGAFTIDSLPAPFGSPNIELEETWQLEAELEYREDIQVVPGSGPVRGVWQRLADIYAIRDNAGATAGILHIASATGWTTSGITMADYIRFDAGLAAGANVSEGDTLTGGTSGTTATIHRIVLNGGSGAWDSSGEGHFILTNVSGPGFQNNESLESPALTAIATADGANATFSFPVGGNYRFLNHNFFGGAATYRAYGCNGVGPAFEIDEGKVVSPILMPNNPVNGDTNQTAVSPTNTPFLIEEHRGHLFLGFEGGSAQHSVTGLPLNFSGFLGAGEFGLGDELTSMNSIVGNVLILSTTRETRGLFGASVSDWELRIVAEQSGSLLFGAQKIDTVYSLDDLGITSVARSDQYGDFISATVSQYVQPIIISARPRFNDSTIVRESNQFRLYLNDNSFLIMYVPAGSQAESRQGSYTAQRPQFGFGSYDIPVKLIFNTDDDTGKERTYFVTDNATWQGYVFEDQIGKNFDGEPIASYVRTAFNNIGSPSYRKKFRRADLELNAPSQLDIRFQSDLTYSAAESSSSIDDLDNVMNIPAIDIVGGGGFWDVDNWDEFLWDGQTITTARANLQGTGENIGFLIFNETAKTDPFVMQGITLHYDMRRLQR
jgi:hypothetical protein